MDSNVVLDLVVSEELIRVPRVRIAGHAAIVVSMEGAHGSFRAEVRVSAQWHEGPVYIEIVLEDLVGNQAIVQFCCTDSSKAVVGE